MTRKFAAFSLGALLMAAGCATGEKQSEARQLAEKRFEQQKAKIKFLLASEQFQNGQIKSARKSAEEAIGLYGEDPDYYLLLVKIYLEEGELALAGKLLSSCKFGDERNPAFSYLAGVIAERYGSQEDALDHYRKAYELDPASTEYAMAYGEMLVTLDRPSEALVLIAEAMPHSDRRGRLQALRGDALQMLRRYGEAAEAYGQALIESPTDPSLRESLAMVLLWDERYTAAIPHLRQLLSRFGSETPEHLVLALARCYFAVGDAATATAYLRELTRSDPENVAAWRLLARCHVAMENFTDGRIAARRAVELAPEAPGGQALLGFVLCQQQNWIEARRCLEAAIRIDPDDTLALCMLGQVNEATGAPRRAMHYYQRALQVVPEDPLAQYLLDKLQSEISEKP